MSTTGFLDHHCYETSTLLKLEESFHQRYRFPLLGFIELLASITPFSPLVVKKGLIAYLNLSENQNLNLLFPGLLCCCGENQALLVPPLYPGCRLHSKHFSHHQKRVVNLLDIIIFTAFPLSSISSCFLDKAERTITHYSPGSPLPNVHHAL